MRSEVSRGFVADIGTIEQPRAQSQLCAKHVSTTCVARLIWGSLSILVQLYGDLRFSHSAPNIAAVLRALPVSVSRLTKIGLGVYRCCKALKLRDHLNASYFFDYNSFL